MNAVRKRESIANILDCALKKLPVRLSLVFERRPAGFSRHHEAVDVAGVKISNFNQLAKRQKDILVADAYA